MANAARSRKRNTSAPLRVILIILISLVIGLNVYQWNARRLMGDAFPMPLGFGMAVVLSGSMEPALNVNDLVIVVPAKSVNKGDVIVFQQEGSLIIHRVINVDEAEKKIQTQGDANNTPDEPIDFSQVKGRKLFHIPFVGLLIRGLKTPVGIIAVLAFALFLMHNSWKKEKESGDEELDAIKAEIRKLKEEQAAEEKKNQVIPTPEDDGIDIPLQHK